MFDPQDKPRVFHLPPGVDFPRALIDGLRARCDPADPLALARVQVIVNTRRMARRLRDLFEDGPPGLLPRIALVTDFGSPAALAAVPQAVSALRRRLELRQLVIALIDRSPGIAPRAAAFDLADSLAAFLDEMEGEGVDPAALDRLDLSGHAEHWARMQAFIGITRRYFDGTDPGPDSEARARRVVEATIADWQESPPDHPVILAGSTGSRGTTQMLMQAVARLPQGAVVLPGFDTDLPPQVWAKLDDPLRGEDHPQFRFARLMSALGLSPDDLHPWADAAPPSPARNRAVSLALRPAPVTHAWLEEGPCLPDLDEAFAAVTLIEAPSPRAEAQAIALRLRQAAEDGQTAALITPDRMLTRQVTAMLDRWDIRPDDSAGLPLHLSPPGRFLRHVADLATGPVTTDRLLTILKHPLCHTGADRGDHLRMTRDLELHLRDKGLPFPDADLLRAWAGAHPSAVPGWADWVTDACLPGHIAGDRDLGSCVADLRQRAERLAQGPGGDGAGELWAQNAGEKALETLAALDAEAGHGGDLTARDFADLLGALLQRGEVRDRDAGHPGIMIWGTLEARVQGADLLILGGLNDGVWPEAMQPDPWLNRSLRAEAGLLLPDRRIGLAAHDFQQAIAAPEVWLTRAIRSDEAETVPSRWINRLENLLSGLQKSGYTKTLDSMKARGKRWLALVQATNAVAPVQAAPRPSPRPPVGARPRRLRVTEIRTLIRDPYAIYARRVLRLDPLAPLVRTPDARIKGTVVHDVLEAFLKGVEAGDLPLDAPAMIGVARAELARSVPWPTARAMWLAQFARQADWFVAGERDRRAVALPVAMECKARSDLTDPVFTLTARADRIDRDEVGNLILYDYKTGTLPTEKQQRLFDKQLLIEAAMAERGDFEGLSPAPVIGASYIGLGAQRISQAPLDEETPSAVWAHLAELLRSYLSPTTGFTARRFIERESHGGDYDQLARFGEWDGADAPVPEDLR